ncbi:MAG: tryptophan--tRNA ligase [Pseudobdellovibrionaceae bacterium]|jgi:tryptophanyl-tRNA synthetase
MTKVRVMSGKRVSGRLHLGHYWGAIRNWIALQDQYECYFGVMDLHGLTSEYKIAGQVNLWSRELFAEYIALGIDPNKSTLFIQSHIPEHVELFLFLANMTPMGWLERVPTWKDAEQEAKQTDTHNLGRFAYPVLQTADIAMYFGQKVPVGSDQVSHLEISREIIRRFNSLFKGKIPEPEALLTDTPLLPGLDGKKMSSSKGNAIDLIEDSEKSLKKKVNLMMTDPARVRRDDPGDPLKCPVFSFHKLYSTEDDLKWAADGCRSAGIGCGDCKQRLFENIEKVTCGPRERKKELLNNTQELDSIIAVGCDRAREVAKKNLKIIKSWMKF